MQKFNLWKEIFFSKYGFAIRKMQIVMEKAMNDILFNDNGKCEVKEINNKLIIQQSERTLTHLLFALLTIFRL